MFCGLGEGTRLRSSVFWDSCCTTVARTRVLFTSEGRGEREINRWVGAVVAVIWTLYWTAVMKRELSVKVY